MRVVLLFNPQPHVLSKVGELLVPITISLFFESADPILRCEPTRGRPLLDIAHALQRGEEVPDLAICNEKYVPFRDPRSPLVKPDIDSLLRAIEHVSVNLDVRSCVGYAYSPYTLSVLESENVEEVLIVAEGEDRPLASTLERKLLDIGLRAELILAEKGVERPMRFDEEVEEYLSVLRDLNLSGFS
ncbi:MAG: hypothetical protein QXK42_06780 [Candidatus Korarchaeum sp.]